jgi:hypothetical protein
LRVILLAFFFPLALYLLVLGLLNRRRYPLLVSGVWDGIGLLFGVSGFVLFAGPAIFSALSERWRLYWLLGKADGPFAGPGSTWQLWLFLALLYLALVISGAVYYLRRQRHLTAIYNAATPQVEQALTQSCEQLGLNPVRSGDLFLFGFSLPPSVPSEQITATLPLPVATEDRSAILELDSFPLMRHVTLRWDPVDSSLRPLVERELAQQLARMPSEDNLLGGWLLLLGFLLLGFEFLGSLFLILLNLAVR